MGNHERDRSACPPGASDRCARAVQHALVHFGVGDRSDGHRRQEEDGKGL